jgi:excisionase family DNA binding protein
MERLTYTVDEVAEILGLSRAKTYDLVARGEIPTVPIPGRRRLIARLTLHRLLETPSTAPTTHEDPAPGPDPRASTSLA